MRNKVFSLHNYYEIIIGILKTLRPKQWTKNLLIFAGIIFSKNLFQAELLGKVILAFFLFSLVSGCVYLINDISDIDEDRKHPKKKKRPLPSGEITIMQAKFFFLIIFVFSIGLSFWLSRDFGLIALLYFSINILYTFYFKQVVLLDVIFISFGFVLRAIAGAVVINVRISPWLILCTVLLALFLGFSKRRNEIIVLKDNAIKHREVLEDYSIEFLDQMITIVTSGTIVAYSLYTFYSNESIYLMLTIPFVIYGIFRYLYLIHQHGLGGHPEEILLSDKPLLFNIILWGSTASFIIYMS